MQASILLSHIPINTHWHEKTPDADSNLRWSEGFEVCQGAVVQAAPSWQDGEGKEPLPQVLEVSEVG